MIKKRLGGALEFGVLSKNGLNAILSPEAFKSGSVLVDERADLVGSEGGYGKRTDSWARQLREHLGCEEARATRSTSEKGRNNTRGDDSWQGILLGVGQMDVNAQQLLMEVRAQGLKQEQ